MVHSPLRWLRGCSDGILNIRYNLKYSFLKTLVFIFALITSQFVFSQQPTLSFTFDDGITYNQGGYELEEWNQMILQSLEEADLRAVFFVRTKGMNGKKGRQVLSDWDRDGHKIANHTVSHPNFNNEKKYCRRFST